MKKTPSSLPVNKDDLWSYLRLFWDFVQDIILKLEWRFWFLLFLLVLLAIADAIRLPTALLIFPFIGVDADVGTLPLIVEEGFSLLGLPYRLTTVVLLTFLLFLFYSLILVVVGWFSAACTQLVVLKWREELIDGISKSNWQFLLGTSHGDLQSALSQETIGIETATRKLSATFTGFAVAATYISLAFYLVPQGTINLLLFGGLLMLINSLFIRRVFRSSRNVVAQRSELMSMASEFFRNIKIIKASARYNSIRATFSERLHSIMEDSRRAYFLPAVSGGISELVVITSALITLLLIFDSVSTGQIVALFALLIRAFGRAATALKDLQNSVLNIVSFEHAREVLKKATAALEQAPSNNIIPRVLPVAEGVHFRNVRVILGNKVILDGVNVDFPMGEVTAIVGPSGAGKTTLIDSLLRLVPIQDGEIDVDGINLNKYEIDQWRHQIGYVPQEPTLFHGNVRDNIRWFSRDIGHDEVVKVSKLVRAHEFIAATENGYDSLVGELGMKFSGGQRQRIALARALITNPQILILDEATSALDSNLENEVMETVYSQIGKRIVVVIAHRLSTVRNANQIYVMDEGRVIDQGTWETLSKKDGIFRELYEKQAL